MSSSFAVWARFELLNDCAQHEVHSILFHLPVDYCCCIWILSSHDMIAPLYDCDLRSKHCHCLRKLQPCRKPCIYSFSEGNYTKCIRVNLLHTQSCNCCCIRVCSAHSLIDLLHVLLPYRLQRVGTAPGPAKNPFLTWCKIAAILPVFGTLSTMLHDYAA